MNGAERKMVRAKEFRNLVAGRWLTAAILSSSVFLMYYGFILMLGLSRTTAARRIGEATTWASALLSSWAGDSSAVSTRAVTWPPPLLAELLGGTPFLGFIAAVALATIMAVVAGLTLSGASALSHDIYVNVIRRGQAGEQEQVRVARVATVAVGLAAILLGIFFKGQNVAFMVGLAFAVAASGNFPALLLSIIWRRLSTTGAAASIVAGAVLATLLIILSPTVWVDILKHQQAIFPLNNPAVVSMPGGFAVAFLGSLLFPDRQAEVKFEEQQLRTYLAVGAE